MLPYIAEKRIVKHARVSKSVLLPQLEEPLFQRPSIANKFIQTYFVAAVRCLDGSRLKYFLISDASGYLIWFTFVSTSLLRGHAKFPSPPLST